MYQLFALYHWHCLQYMHTCIHVKWYRNFFLQNDIIINYVVCVVLAICAPATAFTCLNVLYTHSLHIIVKRKWMDNKKEHFRANLRIEWWEDLRDVQVLSPLIRYPVESGRAGELEWYRGGSTTDFQAPNDALDVHARIFRVECARFKRGKTAFIQKENRKGMLWSRIYPMQYQISLSLSLYVPLSIPPCKHFKR